MSLLSRFRPLGWTPSSLARAALRGLPNVPARVLSVRYPFRLLRYWFMHELLSEAARECSKPLAIAEVGVDHGQQLAFALHADAHPWWQRWDAYDCAPRSAELAARGYTGIVTADLESAGAPALLPPEAYDVVIACHVLEHLHEPEAGVIRLARMLKPGGMLIGGGPVTPHPGLVWRERRLRRAACAAWPWPRASSRCFIRALSSCANAASSWKIKAGGCEPILPSVRSFQGGPARSTSPGGGRSGKRADGRRRPLLQPVRMWQPPRRRSLARQKAAEPRCLL